MSSKVVCIPESLAWKEDVRSYVQRLVVNEKLIEMDQQECLTDNTFQVAAAGYFHQFADDRKLVKKCFQNSKNIQEPRGTESVRAFQSKNF